MAKSDHFEIGIDVGGTKIAAVLLRRGRVIESSILATPQDSLEHFLIMIKAALDPLLEHIQKLKGTLNGIGIGVPGIINYERQEITLAHNLPFLNKVRIAEALKKQLEKPELNIVIDNDANCFVRAEATMGAGKQSANVYGITIGTGIGAGWWYKGEIYLGSHGSASESGHMIVDFDKQIKLEEAYNRLTQRNPALMAEEAYRGDLLAEKAFMELGAYLGIALSTIVNILDPEIIVLGGGAIASSDLFIKSAKENLKQYTFSPASKNVKLVKSKLGPLAGAIGAGLLVSK